MGFMEKTVLTILVCGALVLGLTGCGSKKEYTLTLPKEENIESVFFEKDNNKKEVKDTEEIKDIIYVLSGSGKRLSCQCRKYYKNRIWF